jgi:two-component system KDP operon response regulator KdpE
LRVVAQLLAEGITVPSDSPRGDILIVDDEEDIVTFLSAVLSDEGFPLRSAGNGREALDAIREEVPALVILDLMMPGINGMEVLETLRNGFVDTPPAVLVLSAKSSHKDVLDALEKGACDFIPKPFDLDDLLLRVRVWMDRAATTAETAPTTLRIFTLAPFRVLLGDHLLLDENTGDARTRLIVKYLVTNANQSVDHEDLLYLVWPDLQRDEAAEQLRQRMAQLRTLFRADLPEHEYIVEAGGAVHFDTSQDCWCDADEFESQVRLAQQAQEAGEMDAALGTFLAALSLYNEDYLRENIYDDWPSDRREKLREFWMSALFRSGAITADRCEFSDSIRFMKRVLDADPYRENAYQALMLYLTRAGRRSEAIQLYRYAERLFAQHLAAQPAPSTRMLYEKILRGEAG